MELTIKLDNCLFQKNELYVDVSLVNNSNTTIKLKGVDDTYFYKQFSFNYIVDGEKHHLSSKNIFAWSVVLDEKELIQGASVTFRINILKNYNAKIILNEEEGDLECLFNGKYLSLVSVKCSDKEGIPPQKPTD
jgi:hypothetical protein